MSSSCGKVAAMGKEPRIWFGRIPVTRSPARYAAEFREQEKPIRKSLSASSGPFFLHDDSKREAVAAYCGTRVTCVYVVCQWPSRFAQT